VSELKVQRDMRNAEYEMDVSDYKKVIEVMNKNCRLDQTMPLKASAIKPKQLKDKSLGKKMRQMSNEINQLKEQQAFVIPPARAAEYVIEAEWEEPCPGIHFDEAEFKSGDKKLKVCGIISLIGLMLILGLLAFLTV